MNLARNKGFTLIELLVVIFIIALLATLLMANLAGIRGRGRDAQRKSDINQIQKALELYKNNQSPPVYPPTASWSGYLTSGSNPVMRAVPQDPNYAASVPTWPNYSYTRDPNMTGDNLTYRLIACLENASDPQRDAAKASYCPAMSGSSFTRYEP